VTHFFRRFIHVVLFSLFLMGLSQGQLLQTSDLVGRWESAECESEGNDQYRKRVFEFSEMQWELQSVFFADAACTVPTLMGRVFGAYILQQPSSVAEGATNVDMVFQHFFFTAYTPETTVFLNQQGCGNKNFQVGIEQETSSMGCFFPPTRDYRLEYDLVRLENNLLYFGERPSENIMNMPENRPTKTNGFALARVRP
jgi:hypothetical protein